MTGERTLPNLGLVNRWTPASNGWDLGMDADLATLDAMIFLTVISATQTAPNASPVAGDRYIVPVGGTGSFLGADNEVAVYDDGGWLFYAPQIGWEARVLDAEYSRVCFLAGAWKKISYPYDFHVFRQTLPVSPEPIFSLVMPRAIVLPVGLTGSRASLRVATTSARSLPLLRNAVSIGSIEFAAGATNATFIFTAAVTLALGDIFDLLPPVAVDATLAGFRAVLAASR